ncbi:hypothetical protein DYQ86_02810 [Acidobacteria bacterium AB60]|nr:hypothetical protein DYQ86_02810 [Acidobacteria bacterium AB60]
MATLPSPVTEPSAGPNPLAAIVSGAALTTIADVITTMEAIDQLLPDNDGLKWFNRLYLMVTRQVDTNPPAGAWQDPTWLLHLDVVFAGLYFRAIRQYLAQDTATPTAWSVLLEARHLPGIERIQFALAGMNAHINRDLAVALVQTNLDLARDPQEDGPEHTDYLAINDLLDAVMPQALEMLSAGPLGEAAEDSGKVGRLLSSFDIRAARDAAWDFAGVLCDLDGFARDAALSAQDVSTGALGRALLTPL